MKLRNHWLHLDRTKGLQNWKLWGKTEEINIKKRKENCRCKHKRSMECTQKI